MEEEVQRLGGRSGAAVEADAGGELAVEAHRGGSDAGQGHAAGRAEKKILKPSRYRPVVEYLSMSYRVSERRACRVTRLHRGTYRYGSHKNPWTALRMRIREIAQARVRYGYRKIRVLLNREGWGVGKSLMQRLYREEGLGLKQRPKRRRRAAEHPAGAGSSNGGQSSLEFGLYGRPVDGWAAVSGADDRGCVHPRESGD